MFTLTFETDNAAFECDSQVPLLLKVVARMIEKGYYSGPICDVNGNRVGSYEYTKSAPSDTPHED